LALIRGKYEEAESWLEQGINFALEWNVKWVESGQQIDLAYTHSQIGHYEEALKECQLASENAQKANLFRFEFQRLALEMKGLVQLAHHSIKEVQKTAQELKEFIDSGIHKNSIRLYYHLMGRIELEKGNYSQAVELIQKALSLTSFQRDERFIESLGLSYYEAGDLDNALKQYEKIISLTPGNTFYGDIYSKSFYMLGRIYQEQGETSKAIENYEKFLDLWKDADPGIAEVEDAKKRLAGLK
jgi:tetratricopeptide (TPR) repeat protein